MYTKNAEFKAGIVVLASLAVLLGLLYYSGSAREWLAAKRQVHLRFVPGFVAPKVGDPVQMNGVKIGSIAEIRQQEETRTGARLTDADRARLRLRPGEDGTVRELYVLALARIERDQTLPEGTTGQISLDLTGQRKLALLPGISSRDLTDEDTTRKPILVTSAGDLTDVQRQIEQLVRHVETLVDTGTATLQDVRGVVTDVRAKLSVVDLAMLQNGIGDAVGSARATIDGLRPRLDAILAKVDDAAGSMRVAASDTAGVVRRTGEGVQGAIDDLRAVLAELKGLVLRVSPKVEAALDEFARAARSVGELGDSLRELGPDLRAVVARAGLDVDEFLERLVRTAHNLQDASEDLRSHPWKLTQKPDPGEIAYEHLADSAKSLVEAMGEIRRATEQLRLLDQRADLADPDRRAQVERWTRVIEAAYTVFGRASARFQELLQQGPLPKAK